MYYYINAYRTDGSEILGTLDNQAAFEAKNYKRKAQYLRLFKVKTSAHHYRIYQSVSRYGDDRSLVETVFAGAKKYYKTLAGAKIAASKL